MRARWLLRLLLPPVIPAVLRRLRRAWSGDPAKRFASGDAPAWSPDYFAYRERRIEETLQDAELMKRFRRSQSLPPGYGTGVDERVVEYPWVLARLGVPAAATPRARCLDAGSALNHGILVRRPELEGRELHVVTLAPEANCFWRRGISYLFADLRDLPIRDEYYDAIVSVSTLEHVGCDNTLFGDRGDSEVEGGADAAMKELWRILRPGGRLLLTVPFGRRRTDPAFRVFDAALLEELIQALPDAGRAVAERTFYRYGPGGWRLATAEECADAEFVPWIMEDPVERGPFPEQRDRAAAARAVACLRIEKP